MKAWIVYYYDNEWCSLVHAETRGKACAYVRDCYDKGFDFLDFSAIRLPGLDDKPITFDNAADAGFFYQNPDTGILEPTELHQREAFINDCNCKICKEHEKTK